MNPSLMDSESEETIIVLLFSGAMKVECSRKSRVSRTRKLFVFREWFNEPQIKSTDELIKARNKAVGWPFQVFVHPLGYLIEAQSRQMRIEMYRN